MFFRQREMMRTCCICFCTIICLLLRFATADSNRPISWQSKEVAHDTRTTLDGTTLRHRRHIPPWMIGSTINEIQVPLEKPSKAPTRKPSLKNLGRLFDKYLVIVFENQHYDSVMQNSYFKNLTSHGVLFTNFSALTHPSYPNYLGMVAGSTFQVKSNIQQNLTNSSIADLLEMQNLTWKNYAADYPGNCSLGSSYNKGLYQRKHVPFLSFQSIQLNSTRCGHVVPATQFEIDWKSRQLPNYSFYSPNMNDSGHDTNLKIASNWLQSFLGPLLSDSKGMASTIIQITFDEAYPVTGDNRVYTLLIGPMVAPGLTINTAYNHYDMLRTVEHNFQLGTLGRNDKEALIIRELWGQVNGNQTS
jgi:hypothetical protein